ncbi:DUF2213 domain-containing protein [Bordetella sp. 02P26C-1]|uniref:DUF2213 domain-containing protein n=1 Tax=Bordetella sp. 02P26C-1 TaxID=2683195 RepID=UPI00135523B8|nr:DUF2213 domain-containing protein [Bordetella sp. 02P26C-1]MVW80185.1 DUF2213 domain-containing protein [Bordetella sp. 02P26C-1]
MKHKSQEGLAFDRASVRTVDQDGRLHVAITNISKATVNPYRGSEIPDWEQLGLHPDRIYQLLRDPKELEAAASTFNNIPLLNRHVPVSVDEPQHDLVVGSTGTDAVFEAPYLKNSLVVWDAVAIAGIDTAQQKELSCAYRYRADMTPGVYEGTPYDGVMRDLRGNHVALVEVGRAGPDVVVSDSNPFHNSEYPNMKHSKTAIAVAGALRAYLRPKLAQDAKIGDLGPIVRGLTPKNISIEKPRLLRAVQSRMQGKLAQDADLEDLAQVIDTFCDEKEDTTLAGDDEADVDPADPQKEALATDDELMGKLRELIAAKLGEEEAERVMTALGEPTSANDSDPDPDNPKDPEMVSKTAMDAALKKAADEATVAAVQRLQAMHTAEKEVRSLVGEVAAMDSAEAVYKFALDSRGVDLTGVHPSAFRSLVKMLVSQESTPSKPAVAMDSAVVKTYDAKYNANRLIRS